MLRSRSKSIILAVSKDKGNGELGISNKQAFSKMHITVLRAKKKYPNWEKRD